MRKPTKRWCVDSWLHVPSGTMLNLYFDKEHKDFWGRIGTHLVTGKSLEEAKAAMDERAKELLAPEAGWRRVIRMFVVNERTRHVGLGRDNSHNSPRVGFHCQRLWVREAEDGYEYTRDWDREPADQVEADMQVRGGDVRRAHAALRLGDDDVVEMPYSDELWDALMRISDRLGAIREQLADLSKRDDFAQSLIAGALPLLRDGEGSGS